jgi:hypothetical protein
LSFSKPRSMLPIFIKIINKNRGQNKLQNFLMNHYLRISCKDLHQDPKVEWLHVRVGIVNGNVLQKRPETERLWIALIFFFLI